ncbi:MAG: response regulator [Anaerolineae bacterium]|nr:response regulator [Anaerolineae bacterium]
MGESKTALIVEDSRVQATHVGQLLIEVGLQVLYAGDGLEGVQKAQRYHPDIIILDLEMPRMHGLEACRRLKQDARTADIPIVMLTSHADEAVMVLEGIELGAIDFIPKDGFADVVLVETLRQLHLLPNGTPTADAEAHLVETSENMSMVG